MIRVGNRATVRAFVLPVQGFRVVPADSVEDLFPCGRRQRWPQLLKVFQSLLPLACLFTLQTPQDLRQLQGFAQLARYQYFLAHHFAAVRSGCQHTIESSDRIQRRFNIKLFVIQCRDLFNE